MAISINRLSGYCGIAIVTIWRLYSFHIRPKIAHLGIKKIFYLMGLPTWIDGCPETDPAKSCSSKMLQLAKRIAKNGSGNFFKQRKEIRHASARCAGDPCIDDCMDKC